MAKILYEVKQNQNQYNAGYGQWYAKVKALETLNTRKLAQHISEHGSIYTPDVVYGVLEKFRSCLVEMLLESKKVKIEGVALGPKERFAMQRTLTRVRPREGVTLVELEGVEPSSKQGNHTLSTRLFQTSVFEHQQDLDHQLTP